MKWWRKFYSLTLHGLCFSYRVVQMIKQWSEFMLDVLHTWLTDFLALQSVENLGLLITYMREKFIWNFRILKNQGKNERVLQWVIWKWIVKIWMMWCYDSELTGSLRTENFLQQVNNYTLLKKMALHQKVDEHSLVYLSSWSSGL